MHDIYIGQRVRNGTKIECWGYITGLELERVNPKNFGYGLCRHWLLKNLHPIEDFLKKAKKGERF